MRDLRVAEVFGPTIQGEGPIAGEVCWFLRLSGCDLQCSWCDTPYTWDWTGKNGVVYDPSVEASAMSVEALADRLSDARTLVVTGGEPLLQRTPLYSLINLLPMPVWIETNGRHDPLPGVNHVVSPKLANAGMARNPIKMDALLAHADAGSHLKVVCQSEADVDEVEYLVNATGWDRRRVWVMPEGMTPEAIELGLRALADVAIGHGFNLSPRLHTTIWGNTRGH